MSRLINSNPLSKKQTFLHDADDGGMIIETKQDVTELVNQNKDKSNSYQKGSLIGNTQAHWQHVAEIPSNVYVELMTKFGDPKNNPEATKKWK